MSSVRETVAEARGLRFTVGEVVEAGICARRFALARAGARAEHPAGTPVGALVHGTVHDFVQRAPDDARLASALAPGRPLPDVVAGCAEALMDALLIARSAPLIGRSGGDDLLRAGRAVRELARLLSTALRRARVAGTPPGRLVRHVLDGSERNVEVRIATPLGEATVTGRLDLIVRNEVDGRLEVWELKTHVASSAADEQAALYALALRAALPREASALRPAVLQLAADGRVVLRAVPPIGLASLNPFGARLAAMVGWAAAPEHAPPAEDRADCVACPLQAPCWSRFGPTLPLAPAGLDAPPLPAGAAAPFASARSDGAATPPATTLVDVLIGHDDRDGDVRWSPGRAEPRLESFGFLVTGDSGQGKSQTIRALVAKARASGLPVLVFDFKNDYSDAAFAASAALAVHDVREAGLPWNPLTLRPRDGRVFPVEHAYQVAGILERVLNLGVQQGAALRQAILSSYRAAGLAERLQDARRPIAGPDFADVLARIDQAALHARLDPFADLHLLTARADPDGYALDRVLSGGVVLNLTGVANDQLKAALAELSLLSLHHRLLEGEQPRELRRLLVLDEAHRVARSDELRALLREGRAFGLGCAVGTQFPGDLPDEVQGSLATRLFLRNEQDAHRTSVVRQLVGTASGPDATQLRRALRDLSVLEGYFTNAHYRPFRRIRVLPHHLRGSPSSRSRG